MKTLEQEYKAKEETFQKLVWEYTHNAEASFE